MNSYLVIVLAAVIGFWALETLTDYLNLRHLPDAPPDELREHFDAEKYAKSRDYQRQGFRFSLIHGALSTALTVAFILLGGFEWVDSLARTLGEAWGTIGIGLLFFGILGVLRAAIQLPFTVYGTFVLEERFGFNRTTPRTFILDLVKGTVLGVLIGAPILAGILYFFEETGTHGWLYAWIAVVAFQLIIAFVAPAWIMPLFNKYEDLSEGELKSRIEAYLNRQGLPVRGIYVMDGSRRSSKANAFFTGFGTTRRLVLFDTLVEKLGLQELVAVLAHEVGHFRLKHIIKSIVLSITITGAIFYLLSLLIRNEGLFAAFRMDQVSVHAGLVLASFLLLPLSKILSLLTHGLSRRYEFQADEFAIRTTSEPEALAGALKKLSADHLSHVSPHPLKVLMDYTHPPVLERVKKIREKSALG